MSLPFTAVRLCATCGNGYEYPLEDGWTAVDGVWRCPSCSHPLNQPVNVPEHECWAPGDRCTPVRLGAVLDALTPEQRAAVIEYLTRP